MAFVVEDDTGVKSANAYVSVQEFKDYHADRGNALSGGSGDQQKAIVKATDYIDKRFGARFKGQKAYGDLNTARATLSLTSNPLDTETYTVGAVVYTMVAAPPASANQVQIGASVQETIANLVAAINATGTTPDQYGAGTVENPDAAAAEITGDRALIYAREPGSPGNSIATTTTATGSSFNFATLSGGGDDDLEQPLEFPRINIFDRYGQSLAGRVPRKLRQAVSEYALRILAGKTLDPDPVFDDSGLEVRRTKTVVGPIETEKEFGPGGSLQIPAYPAADALLTDLLHPVGGAWR